MNSERLTLPEQEARFSELNTSEEARHIRAQLADLVWRAGCLGFTVEVRQTSVTPPRMGNTRTEWRVTPARHAYTERDFKPII